MCAPPGAASPLWARDQPLQDGTRSANGTRPADDRRRLPLPPSLQRRAAAGGTCHRRSAGGDAIYPALRRNLGNRIAGRTRDAARDLTRGELPFFAALHNAFESLEYCAIISLLGCTKKPQPAG